MTVEVLRSLLAERDGVWNRPDGDWLAGPATEAQRVANSSYRLGSKALCRNELDPALRWLTAATTRSEPSARMRTVPADLQGLSRPTTHTPAAIAAAWLASPHTAPRASAVLYVRRPRPHPR